ncbi:MAG: IPTL-CTERM sorting domain-containing protein [Deltaproteobacteria bacterium]|nr:IPTL-CTERM sorting domain-containing protein [Deltaproteobacteria bacterium]
MLVPAPGIPVPTVNEWGLILLAFLLAATGWVRRRHMG